MAIEKRLAELQRAKTAASETPTPMDRGEDQLAWRAKTEAAIP
jgi:hypothetical protein